MKSKSQDLSIMTQVRHESRIVDLFVSVLCDWLVSLWRDFITHNNLSVADAKRENKGEHKSRLISSKFWLDDKEAR